MTQLCLANCSCSVPTEAHIGRFDQKNTPYSLNMLADVDWSKHPPWLKLIFTSNSGVDDKKAHLKSRTPQELDEIMSFCFKYHKEDELFLTFDEMTDTIPLVFNIPTWIDRFPPLVFALLKKYPPEEHFLTPELATIGITIVQNIIRSATSLGIASLVALEKISSSINQIPMSDYLDLLMLAAHSVRSVNVVQEILLVIHDARGLFAPSQMF